MRLRGAGGDGSRTSRCAGFTTSFTRTAHDVEEVFNAIGAQATGGGEATDSAPILLGSHAGEIDDSWGTEGPVDESVIAVIRRIVEKWPPPETPIRGRSLADALSRADVRPERPADRVLAALRRALLGAATKRTAGLPPRRASSWCRMPCRGIRPARRGRAQCRVSAAAYWRPAPFARARTARAGLYRRQRQHGAVCAVPLRALVALRHVEREVFSSRRRVRPISLQGFSRGGSIRPRTTFSGYHAAAPQDPIVTDGYVGRPTAAHAKAIRRSGLTFVSRSREGWRGDCKRYPREWTKPVLTPAAPSQRRAHEGTTAIR